MADEMRSGEARVPGTRVFIVHGHHEALRESVARVVERLGLTPTILHEQPNSGRTIIEKFEAQADVDFAVVLLTGDDEGRALKDGATRARARQNVVFELGYFFGALGRNRVCALCEPGVELPSDIHGIVYVQLDAGGAWRFALAQELRSAGLTVDVNNLLAV
ncbi:nucleotide-binding protein [Paraburkholderia sp. Tr-20389]|nr:nucleotide-binding protein [Paraburkholderia sp. Tr-20389]